MPLFMYHGAYTTESLAAMIKNPQDRLEITKPALEALGARLVTGGFLFGTDNVIAIVEAPDDIVAGVVAMYIAGAGPVKHWHMDRLFSGPEWVEVSTRAQHWNLQRPSEVSTS